MPEEEEDESKRILIVMGADGSCKVSAAGIPTMPELIGILETVKAMKINEMLGIRPTPPPASPILLPKKPTIIH